MPEINKERLFSGGREFPRQMLVADLAFAGVLVSIPEPQIMTPEDGMMIETRQ